MGTVHAAALEQVCSLFINNEQGLRQTGTAYSRQPPPIERKRYWPHDGPQPHRQPQADPFGARQGARATFFEKVCGEVSIRAKIPNCIVGGHERRKLMTNIDKTIAQALLDEGLAVIPTAGGRGEAPVRKLEGIPGAAAHARRGGALVRGAAPRRSARLRAAETVTRDA